MPIIFLDQTFTVVAVFLDDADAKLFATASKHKYCAVPFNVNNRDGMQLPQVGYRYVA